MYLRIVVRVKRRWVEYFESVDFAEEWKLHVLRSELDGPDVAKELGDENFADIAREKIRSVGDSWNALVLGAAVELESSGQLLVVKIW